MTTTPDHDDFSERLTAHLQTEAELIPTLPTDLAATDRIERRAVRKQRRRTAAVGTAMALAVAGVGGGAMLASAPTNELISADQVSDTADDALTEELAEATTAAASEEGDNGGSSGTLEAPELISDGPAMGWIEVPSPGGNATDVFVHDGRFFTIANSPGAPATLWSSTDGTAWSDRPLPGEADNWSGMSSGDAIVLTGFPRPDDPEQPIQNETWFSTDLGETWRTVDLPDSSPSAGVDSFTTVTALGDVVLATVSSDAVSEGPDGLSFAVYRSVDSGPFEPVDLGQLELGDFAEVSVKAGAFELVIYDNFERRFVSSDGATWTSVSSTSIFRQVVQPGENDQLALSYSSEFPSLERSSDGGATWQEPFEIDDLLIVAAAFNDDGYVLSVQTGTDAEFEEAPVFDFEPTLTKGDLVITVDVEFAEITVTDATTGTEVFRTELDDNGEGEGLTYDEELDVVTITDIDTGELIVSFTGEEFGAANEEQFSALDTFPSGLQIGFTADGETYGWQTPEEAFGVDTGWVDVDSNGEVILATVFSGNGLRIFAATGPTG